MSRNSQVDYTQYVHEYTDAQGRTRYAVAEWSEFSEQYIRPLDSGERAANGGEVHSMFSRTLEYMGGYIDRARALRRARYLFGPNRGRGQED